MYSTYVVLPRDDCASSAPLQVVSFKSLFDYPIDYHMQVRNQATWSRARTSSSSSSSSLYERAPSRKRTLALFRSYVFITCRLLKMKILLSLGLDQQSRDKSSTVLSFTGVYTVMCLP